MLMQGKDVANLAVIYLYHVIFTFLHLIALYVTLQYSICIIEV